VAQAIDRLVAIRNCTPAEFLKTFPVFARPESELQTANG
jgi:hypothetical protein